jgi:hypothetical protein
MQTNLEFIKNILPQLSQNIKQIYTNLEEEIIVETYIFFPIIK